MNLLPKTSGNRPRVACEISPEGVVAARSAEAGSPLAAVAKAELAEGAVIPSLKPGNLVDRVAVTTALRRVMETIGARSNSRSADITLIIPDTAARVLLLDFDALPSKLTEALPLVRFRLKKLLPFDSDEAMVTFQIMSSSKAGARVLAVAIPRDVLSDYETAARESGFEPGAVLPSTLATLAAVDDGDGPVLLVNANRLVVTTAIVRGGVLLLHRTVDLQDHAAPTPPNLPAALFEPSDMSLPLVDVNGSAAEWAAQQPLPEHGRNPYADRAADEAAVQNKDGITNFPVPPVFRGGQQPSAALQHAEPGDPSYSPYAAETVLADLSADSHDSILIAPTSLRSLADPAAAPQLTAIAAAGLHEPALTSLDGHPSPASAGEIAQAVSVAAAYFEDTLAAQPARILSAGPTGAARLSRMLGENGTAQADGLNVRELVESAALLSDAVTASVPRGWLSGVLGALRG